MIIRAATPADEQQWSTLRAAMWPEDSADSHAEEIRRFFREEWHLPSAAFLAEQDGTAVGFVEVSIRPYAEECYSGNVGSVEGWFVIPEERRRGVGAALVAVAENWARDQGCMEMASDAALDNRISAQAHAALGYAQVAEVRCFRKDL